MELEGTSEDLAGYVKKRFGTSNHEVKRSLQIGKKEKKNWLMKDELGEKLMKVFVAARPKMYSYLTDDGVLIRKQRTKRGA